MPSPTRLDAPLTPALQELLHREKSFVYRGHLPERVPWPEGFVPDFEHRWTTHHRLRFGPQTNEQGIAITKWHVFLATDGKLYAHGIIDLVSSDNGERVDTLFPGTDWGTYVDLGITLPIAEMVPRELHQGVVICDCDEGDGHHGVRSQWGLKSEARAHGKTIIQKLTDAL